MSVGGATVGGMAANRVHICTYFDDGGAEHVCPCGSRAFYVIDEDGTEPVLVVLDDADVVELPAHRELAVSA